MTKSKVSSCARWSVDEESSICDAFKNNLPLSMLILLLNERSEDAIVAKARKLGFGVSTVDGDRIFVAGVGYKGKHINRKSEATSDQTTASGIVYNALNEHSNLILAEKTKYVDYRVTLDAVNNLGEKEAKYNDIEPQASIILYDGLLANNLAVQILTENNLSVNPDIVRCLSIHILGGAL